MTEQDPHRVLEVSPGATRDEVTAAYRRLEALYSPERFVDGPLEFVAQAAAKRDQLDAAYQVLTAEPETATPPRAEEALDFRPLPPARGQERPAPPVAVAIPAARVRPATPARRRPLLSLGLLLVVGGMVFAAVSLPGVRTTSSPAALATPVISGLELPYTVAQLDTLRHATQATPSVDSWSKLGDAIFDNLETLREAAPLSAQYQTAASGWSEAAGAYRAALAVKDDPAVRADLALTLVYDGTTHNDAVVANQGLAEAERAFKAAPDNPRVALNYGLVLVALNPPRTANALNVWQALVQHVPQSSEAERAKQLIDSYKQQ